jgi:microcystin-dependent protein
MADPFVAEIRIFACNFAPTGWAFCDGQLLPISQNTALFSLLGTFYGGDGKSTFALPNLQGSVPLNQGQSSASGQQYFLGQQSGSETVTLIQTEIPLHGHTLQGENATATAGDPNGTVWAKGGYSFQGKSGAMATYSTTAPNQAMNIQTIMPAGNSFPHNNLMPYTTLNFCIALQGIFPARP